MATFIPAKDDWAKAFQQIGSGFSEGYIDRADQNSIQKSLMSLGENPTERQILDAITNTKTYSNKAKQDVFNQRLGVNKFEELQRHSRKQEELSAAKNAILEGKETRAALSKAADQEAVSEAVDQLDVDEAIKPSLKKSLTSKDAAKALLNQNKPDARTQKQQDAEETLRKINEVRRQPGFDDLDEVGQYRALSEARVPLSDAEKESKIKASQLNRITSEFDKSYESQKKFIDDTSKAYKAYEADTKPKLRLISKLATDEDLIGPTANKFREALGIPLGSLDNPASELFQKTSLDLLKGLPETYGSRIMKVEVDNFLKTIPTLENSPEGRRMIASNLLKLGEVKEVYYDQMRRMQKQYLESQTKFPKDFEQQVLDQVKPQMDKINNEFIKMSDIKAIPKGTVPFFNPSGEIVFIPKEAEAKAVESGGKRIW